MVYHLVCLVESIQLQSEEDDVANLTSGGPGDLVDTVHQELQRRIMTGALAPGTRIVERDIAAKLAVSRTPVRQAIRRLSHEGFVVLNPAYRYARPVVAPLTADDAEELHDLVAWLDARCALKAAQLPASKRASLTASLDIHNNAFRRAVKAGDLVLALEQDDRFHSAYIGAVGGERMTAIRRAAKPQVERYMRSYLPHLQQRAVDAPEEHQVIIEAIRAGRPSAAQRAALQNWRNAAARLQAAIRQGGERGVWAE